MNGVHDLGGMDGFGPVDVEPNEPVFHHAWERRVFGMVSTLSAQRFTNVHAFRHAIERMDPTHYMTSPYYEHWLTALATLVIEKGIATRAELEAKAGGGVALSQPERAAAGVHATPSPATARFAIGDAVVVRNLHPLGHTRCPRYVRGKRGVVARVDGVFRLPDVAAHSSEHCSEFTYNVRFAGRDLWGDVTDGTAAVHVDLWERYLETP